MSLVRVVKLRIPSGSAKPGPAIGQALGPLGINMALFCKEFNERSETIYKKDVPLSVNLSAMSDRSFTFEIKTPSTAYLIKKVVGMEKGPATPSLSSPAGYITPEEVYEIAKIKQQDAAFEGISLKSICRSVIGTARSMGVKVRESEDA